MTISKHVLGFYRKYLSSFVFFRLVKEVALAGWRSIYITKCLLVRHPLSGKYQWRSLSKAARLSISLVKVAPSEEIQIPAPSFFGYGVERAVARTPQRDITCPKIEVFEFVETLAVGGVDFIFHNKEVIHHDLFLSLQHHCPAENVGVISIKRDSGAVELRLSQAQLEVDEAISLIGQCSENYAHWLTETLPKLAVIDRIERFKHLPLIVDKGLHRNILTSIDLINCHDRKIIEVPRWAPVRVAKLVTVSSPGYERYVPHGIISREPSPYINSFSPAALYELRSAAVNAVKGIESKSAESVYLARSRGSGNLRQIINIEKVEQILLASGVHMLEPDSMSFQEQVVACSNAKIIVGPVGASLVNMIFAAKGCKIVVLAPYYDEANYFYYTNLAGVLGHRIHFVLGRQPCKSRHPMHRDYFVDEDALLSALTEIYAE